MNNPPFNQFLGVQVTSAQDGEAVAELSLESHHLNNRGVAHGGVVSSLLDTALGASVISSIPKAWWCATTSLSVQFIAGAKPGRLSARGRVVRRGSKAAFAEGEILSPDGKILAKAHGTWHLWTQKPGTQTWPDHVTFVPDGERLAVGKIVAVGRNYAAHIEEMGGDVEKSEPVLFFKPSTALVSPGEKVILPPQAGEVHHEVELVAVIGKKARAVGLDDALSHVEGYAVGLDMTLRDVQAKAKKSGSPWSLAKGFDTSAPVSNVVRRDQVGDGKGLGIRLWVNDEIRQEGTTDLMIHSVAELVCLASKWVTLEPGDLLFTGTPSGVGPVRDGDVLRAEIDRVGSLEMPVQASS